MNENYYEKEMQRMLDEYEAFLERERESFHRYIDRMKLFINTFTVIAAAATFWVVYNFAR